MDDSSQSSRAPDADDPVPLKKVRIEVPDPPRRSSTEADNDDSFGTMTSGSSGNFSPDNSAESADPDSFRNIDRRSEGAASWIHSQMIHGTDPCDILRELVPKIGFIPPDIDRRTLWRLIVDILSEPDKHRKLPDVNLLSDVVRLIKTSKKILVLTGAGVSVSCGIPDFRSRDGIYSRLAVDFPNLPDPQAMFDVNYFTQDPRPFFKFAKELYPGQFTPSRSHRFIRELEHTERLLRNYTQNIDTLEKVAGSFATASCLKCKYQVDCEDIRADIFNQTVPRCPKCPAEEGLAILKPDIVFFGENLSDKFYRQMSHDQHEADLLLVIGSSLKVRPVALIPSSLPTHVPQILINREPLPHMQFDVELLGDSDTIIGELSRRLGEEFSTVSDGCKPLGEITELPDVESNHESVISVEDEGPGNIVTSAITAANHNSEHNETAEAVSKTGLSSGDDATSEIAVATDKSQQETEKTENCSSETSDCMEGCSNHYPKGKKELPMWKSKWKTSIVKSLPDGTFYYDGQYRYIFPGAEVTPQKIDEDSSSDDDNSTENSSCASDSEDHDHNAEIKQLPETLPSKSALEKINTSDTTAEPKTDKDNASQS